jgi:hypothetical protein
MQPKFDAQLIEDFNLAGFPPEQQQEMLAQIFEGFQLRMMRVVGEQLSEEQLAAFEQLDPEADEDTLLNWFREQIPNYDQIVAQEYEDYKKQLAEIQG